MKLNMLLAAALAAPVLAQTTTETVSTKSVTATASTKTSSVVATATVTTTSSSEAAAPTMYLDKLGVAGLVGAVAAFAL